MPYTHQVIRWLSYPIIFGSCAVAQYYILLKQLSYWPTVPLVSLTGIVLIALLERVQPYEKQWLLDHKDTFADLLHAFTSLSLLFLSIEIVIYLRSFIPFIKVWPHHWPTLIQLLCVGVIIDFGLWFMHWASHKNELLWRFHALHHSAERLYWLNGERRHPIGAIALASPGITAVVLLGAPAQLIGCWLSIVAVHLSFQHGNLDYSVGIFRKVLAVAEVHRWHHKREYEDAQVNFGEFWMIWDQLFGTYLYNPEKLDANEVGLRESMSNRYIEQISWPFKKQGS